MTDLPTRRFVEVVCTNPKHEYWDQHDWDGNDCIVKVTEPLLSRVEWEATIDYEAAEFQFPIFNDDGHEYQLGKRSLTSYVHAIVDAAVGEDTP